MGRFVDKTAGEWVDLGPCQCPNTPHEADRAFVRSELSGTEWALVFQGNTERALTIFIREWNLTDEDGDPVLVDLSTVGALDTPTFQAIDDWIGKNVAPPRLPNASGAPSRNGSRERGRRTPKTPTTT